MQRQGKHMINTNLKPPLEALELFESVLEALSQSSTWWMKWSHYIKHLNQGLLRPLHASCFQYFYHLVCFYLFIQRKESIFRNVSSSVQCVLTERVNNAEYKYKHRFLTCLRHALCTLHARVEHLFGRYEEYVIRCLLTVHDLQLLNQEVDATVCVLLSDLKTDAGVTTTRFNSGQVALVLCANVFNKYV